MKTVKRLSVLLAVLIVVSIAVSAFAVRAEEAPAFSIGFTQEGPDTAFTLGTDDYSAFISAKEGETEGEFDYRFLIVADIDTFKATQNAKLNLTFAKDGATVKTLTKDVVSELDVYASATALQQTYIAFDTCLIFGIAVTDVPEAAWDNVTVSLVDDTATLAQSQVAVDELDVEYTNGIRMEPSDLLPYFEINNKKDPKKSLVYWFSDTYGGAQVVINTVLGEYTVDLTINGVEYKNIVARYGVDTGRYLVILLEESGITGIKTGDEYICSLTVYDSNGNRVLYDPEFSCVSPFDA